MQIRDPDGLALLKERYNQRLQEWERHQDFVKEAKSGKTEFRIDDNGVLRRRQDDRAFVGDNDVYDVLDAETGRRLHPLDPKGREVYERLRTSDIAVEHEWHASWEPTKHEDLEMKLRIDRQHSSDFTVDRSQRVSYLPGEQAEPLVQYQGGLPPSLTYADWKTSRYVPFNN
jgi:hypothetical protein